MTKRQELLSDYLVQLVEDKGQSEFLKNPDSVQILICMFVVEDMFEIFGKNKKRERKRQ